MVDPVTVLFAGIAVRDLDAALHWYERLIGQPPDMVPNQDEACWKFTDSAWIYVVRDPERAGHGLLTIIVDDLRKYVPDATDLVEQGGMLTAAVTDPDGNKVTFGHPL